MTPVIQQIVTGMMTGSLYALVGVGVVVIVRATEIINFAQAATGTFATFLALMLMQRLPYPSRSSRPSPSPSGSAPRWSGWSSVSCPRARSGG